MVRRPKPQDPMPTVEAIDQRLAELARILRSHSLTDSYRTTLRAESDQLLDRRGALTRRDMVQTG